MTLTTEPAVSPSGVTEDYPLGPVPLSARRSLLSLAPILAGFTLYSGTLFAGGIIGPSFQFWPNLVGLIVIGNLILGLYAALLGYIAGNTGLTTVLMARFSFGSVGSRWVDFILGFTQIGWYAWGSALMAQLLNSLAGVPESWNWLIILFFTYAFCSTAYFGYQAMDWLSRLAVPAMVLLMLLSLSIAGAMWAAGLDCRTWRSPIPCRWELLLPSSWAPLYRGHPGYQLEPLCPQRQDGLYCHANRLLFGQRLFDLFGGLCAKVYGEPDIVQVMAQQGLVVGGLILFFLNMWTTQDNTIYAFSIAGANMFRSSKRTLFVLGGATIALFMAWGGIYEGLVQYLILLGTFIPPIGGIIMADYWIHRQGQFPSLDVPQPAFNWAGVIAYVGASAIAYLTNQIGWGIVPINGIASALVLYVVLSRVLPSVRSQV